MALADRRVVCISLRRRKAEPFTATIIGIYFWIQLWLGFVCAWRIFDGRYRVSRISGKEAICKSRIKLFRHNSSALPDVLLVLPALRLHSRVPTDYRLLRIICIVDGLWLQRTYKKHLDKVSASYAFKLQFYLLANRAIPVHELHHQLV